MGRARTAIAMGWEPTSSVLSRLRDSGERSAWEELFGRFHAPLIAFGRRMGLEASDAEDAAQEALVAFARAYRQGRFDRDKGSLERWLFGFARRQVLAALRRSGDPRLVRTADLGAGSGFLGEQPDPHAVESVWGEEWRREALRRSLARVEQEVEPATFELFRRVVLEGCAVDEVAREAGVPRGRVYNAKYRVQKRLAELAREFERVEG